MGLCVCLGWGDVGDGKRSHTVPWSVRFDHFHVATASSNSPTIYVFCHIFMFCIYVLG
jgi:hypothetical protein